MPSSRSQWFPDDNMGQRSRNGSTAKIVKKTKTKKKFSRPKRRDEKVGCAQKASAVLTRCLFLLHTGIALWRVSLLYPYYYLYFLSIGVGCLLLEMVFTIAVRQGKEYKWFCPSVFFYLLSVVPCLWLLELHQLDTHLTTNLVEGGCIETTFPNVTIPLAPPVATTLPTNATETLTDASRSRRSLEAEDRLPVMTSDFHSSRVKRQEMRNGVRDNKDFANVTLSNSSRNGMKKNRKKKRTRKKVGSTTSSSPSPSSTTQLTSATLLSTTTTLKTTTLSSKTANTATIAKSSAPPSGVIPSLLLATIKTTSLPVQTTKTNATLATLQIIEDKTPTTITNGTTSSLSHISQTRATNTSRETTESNSTPSYTSTLPTTSLKATNKTSTPGTISQPTNKTMEQVKKTTTETNSTTIPTGDILPTNNTDPYSKFIINLTTAASSRFVERNDVTESTSSSGATASGTRTLTQTASSTPGTTTTQKVVFSTNPSQGVQTTSRSTELPSTFKLPATSITTITSTSRPEDGDVIMGTTTTTTIVSISTTDHHGGIEKIGDQIKEFGSNAISYIENTSQTLNELLNQLDPQNWLLALHQVLLFVLVIGRWLLPKGEITRDQLSQLLLVFIGVGADILEFVSETIDDDVIAVRCDPLLHFIIYGVWSWSLLQFTLVLTAAKSRKTRVGFESDDRVTMVSNRDNCCARSVFNDADLWGILVTMLLQDVPFLAFRLYMMIVYRQVHQMMVFFTGKNVLVVCLQVYRLIVLQVERKDDVVDEATDMELQPLKGTLKRLATQARSEDSFPSGDVKNASFKSRNDGTVVVKIHLESEATLKRLRGGTV